MAVGYIYVQLDKQRKLRFDFNALADVEQMLGAGIGTIFAEHNMGFNTIRALYWAGLKWQDKGLTVERAGKILQKCLAAETVTMQELGEYLTEAMKASGLLKSQPEPNEYDEDDEIIEDPEEEDEDEAKN